MVKINDSRIEWYSAPSQRNGRQAPRPIPESDRFHEEDYEGEPSPHFQNEMGSMNTMTERLRLMPTKQVIVDPASVASPLKMATPRKNCTVASKSTGEKKKEAPISKVSVGLAPITQLTALTDKLDQCRI
jgi:hypothetical protein